MEILSAFEVCVWNVGYIFWGKLSFRIMQNHRPYTCSLILPILWQGKNLDFCWGVDWCLHSESFSIPVVLKGEGINTVSGLKAVLGWQILARKLDIIWWNTPSTSISLWAPRRECVTVWVLGWSVLMEIDSRSSSSPPHHLTPYPCTLSLATSFLSLA